MLFDTVTSLQNANDLSVGMTVKTMGYYVVGDGGGAVYVVQNSNATVDGGSVIALQNGLKAILVEPQAVNYKMFGALGNGVNDDGVQMKNAHNYANSLEIPVINLNGDYYVKATRGIQVKTNTNLGQTNIHIDEPKTPPTKGYVFIINRKSSSYDLDSSIFSSLISRLKKGQYIIHELQPYKGNLIRFEDANTIVCTRDSGQTWTMQDFVFVDEAGKFVGEITWNFTNLTKVTVYPCDDNYLVFEGGNFYLSGNMTGTNYMQNGIYCTRSRVIIRNQVVRLKPGHADTAMIQRNGFYNFNYCYDVTLENIKLIPYLTAPQSPYGIEGNTVLDIKLLNITAEGDTNYWGVMGTNLWKNVYITNCKLNRIDVHFHGWNWYIKDCKVGFKSINLSGGGDLIIENTTVTAQSNRFLEFRADYGSKWDGDIRIRQCRLVPQNTTNEVNILYFVPTSNRDFTYQCIFGRTIRVEDFTFDFTLIGDTGNIARLVQFPDMWQTGTQRIQFPTEIQFKDVYVVGRNKGVRFFRYSYPHKVYVPKTGGIVDTNYVTTNAYVRLENIQTEKIVTTSKDVNNNHLCMYVLGTDTYTDSNCWYPKIEIINCQYLHLQPKTFIGRLILRDSSIFAVDLYEGGDARSVVHFINCDFKPELTDDGSNILYLGTPPLYQPTFMNCIFHAPYYDGTKRTDLAQTRYSAAFNLQTKQVFGVHINTRISSEIADPNTLDFELKQMLLAWNGKYLGANMAKRSGPTSSRPTSPPYDGFMYYDTTLNKPVFWSYTQNKWLDVKGNQA
jgi:hypothetical protein